MSLRSAWARPEYRYRPVQVLWRLVRAYRRPTQAAVRLPWGLPLRICPGDAIGRQIWLAGVFDLPVTEVLWRLARRGAATADVGANIGYMTSVLAARGAEVHAFEPNPAANRELQVNAVRWPGAQVTIYSCALSDRAGRACLVLPPPEEANPGLAALGDHGLEVETKTLDQIFQGKRELETLKIDVEGHELQVLSGGAALLRQHRIVHIVFEEHGALPSPVTRLLEEYGYALFSISRDLRGLRLEPLGRPNVPLPVYESPSYLATVRPDQALGLLRPPGWLSLRGRL